MTRWWAVAGLAGVVLLALLSLSRASQAAITDGDEPRRRDGTDGLRAPERAPVDRRPRRAPAVVDRNASGKRPEASTVGRTTGLDAPERAPALSDPAPGTTGAVPDAAAPSTWALLVNVALTQGLFLVVLAGGLALFGVRPADVGLGPTTRLHVAAGVALGAALYLASEAGGLAADRVGLGHDRRLRELLAPESPGGWAVLLLFVLPVIAGFEELLFRGVLIGALAAGFPVSPWLLAAVSSVAFGAGHGAQGWAGVVVTWALGFVLAAGFVLTDSLVAVVVAHYLVNALEFVVHEGFDIEWRGE
ncbi:MAG: CPBP family intramembrane glutamic endopeptidase [Halobacteriales archaeon]